MCDTRILLILVKSRLRKCTFIHETQKNREELNSVLRLRLSSMEGDLEASREECKRLRDSQEE